MFHNIFSHGTKPEAGSQKFALMPQIAGQLTAERKNFMETAASGVQQQAGTYPCLQLRNISRLLIPNSHKIKSLISHLFFSRQVFFQSLVFHRFAKSVACFCGNPLSVSAVICCVFLWQSAECFCGGRKRRVKNLESVTNFLNRLFVLSEKA